MLFRRLFPTLLLLVGVVGVASAKPEYARKEQRACAFCHNSPSPGAIDPLTKMRNTTERNSRGTYYEKHNHTFEGYKVDVKARITLNFQYRWMQEFSDLPRRIAVSDVTGDGKPRLITLHEAKAGKGSVLKIQQWNGKSFTTQFEEESPSAPDRLQVGRFVGRDKLPVIVTESRIWTWNGKTFTSKSASKAKLIIGVARMKSGEERLLVNEGGSDIRSYRVNPQAEEWLVDPAPAPSGSKDVRWLALHGPPDALTQIGLNDVIAEGGVLGYWEVEKGSKPVVYHIRPDTDAEVDPTTQGTKKPRIIFKSQSFFVVVTDTNGVDLWMSPRLEMRPLDVVLENAQGDGKVGMLILLKEAGKDKPRRLGFFELLLPETPSTQ